MPSPVFGRPGLVSGVVGATSRLSRPRTVQIHVRNSSDLPGRDYRGFEITSDHPDMSVCMDACRDEDRCQAFTYVKPGVQGPLARCWLKDGVPARTSNEGTTSGIKVSIEQGADFPGHDYDHFDVPAGRNADHCAMACALDAPLCRSWTYVEPGVQGTLGRCWLKDSVPGAIANAVTTSGVIGNPY